MLYNISIFYYNLFGDLMIEITQLDHNGYGIGKLNNKIVFVRNALPGEIVDIKIIDEKKKYLKADVKTYIKKSNDRIDVICPYYNSCGGCDLLHMSYNDQLKFKQNKINNIINKYLKTKININNIVKSDKQFNYRNKTVFQVKNGIGFFDNKSHDLIKTDSCLLSDKLINKSIKYLNKLELNKIDKITLRANNNKLMIIIDTKHDIDITPIKEISNSIYIHNKSYNLVYKEPFNYQKLNEYNFLIAPDSFFQINNNVCIKMYDKIKSYIKENTNVLDLFCGCGTIGIYTNINNHTIGIEKVESAIESANINKHNNNVKNIEFICGSVDDYISNINNIDTIIIDPPRAGITSKTIENILRIRPKEIIYVSCDPMTLVRDLNHLLDAYNVVELTPFDMFPNTKHIECVCLLKIKEK